MALACSTVLALTPRSSLTRPSWKVRHSRSTRPLACGERAAIRSDSQLLPAAAQLCGSLRSGPLLFPRPMVIVALESPVLIPVNTQRDALLLHYLPRDAHITRRVLMLHLEPCHRDLASGVVDEGQQG